jgi:hypothetical protein
METVNLNQLTANENGIYLLVNTPFSGFAIETFPDGSLQTQVALMHGLQDGVTRRWHPNGQLESEQHFRNASRTAGIGVAVGRNVAGGIRMDRRHPRRRCSRGGHPDDRTKRDNLCLRRPRSSDGGHLWAGQRSRR